ncbi:hypothetical protein DENSPDRAFT_317515 [Dentipellis sp. KUC8613]|nr:hypothetical protein DENSPDRAFT_317515 [Dentipellis sp. KUC8613]
MVLNHASTFQSSRTNTEIEPFSFICEQRNCAPFRIFTNAEQYDAHMRKEHELFPCMFCPRLLANSGRRMVHRETHGHKKSCTVCGRQCCLLFPCPAVGGADRHCHDNDHLPAALAEFGPLRPTKTGYKPRQSTRTARGPAALTPEPHPLRPFLFPAPQPRTDVLLGHTRSEVQLPSLRSTPTVSSTGTRDYFEMPPTWNPAPPPAFPNSMIAPPQTYPPMPQWSRYQQANYGYSQGRHGPTGSYMNMDAPLNAQNWAPQGGYSYP